MIRVLHVVSGMGRGGMETFIMNVYRKLDRTKFQFDFLVHTKEEQAYDQEIKEMGGKIFNVSPRHKGFLKNFNELNSFFKEHNNYKIIHQHVSSLTYIQPLILAKKYKIPMRIIHSHNTKQSGSPIHKIFHKYNQFFIESVATHYFACSNLAAEWLFSNRQFKNSNFEVINNGIDVEAFTYNGNIRVAKRAEFQFGNNLIIGHVGRFNHQKNHEFLIDVFKSVHDKNRETKLLLVGIGILEKEIKEKVQKLGLSKAVVFAGLRSDVSELIQAMDVFVMPSFHEGLPVTLIEAQATGLPCVLSNKISNEVDVSGLIKWCDLNEKPDKWAETILKNNNYINRKNGKAKVIDSGYRIEDVAMKLESIYGK